MEISYETLNKIVGIVDKLKEFDITTDIEFSGTYSEQKQKFVAVVEPVNFKVGKPEGYAKFWEMYPKIRAIEYFDKNTAVCLEKVTKDMFTAETYKGFRFYPESTFAQANYSEFVPEVINQAPTELHTEAGDIRVLKRGTTVVAACTNAYGLYNYLDHGHFVWSINYITPEGIETDKLLVTPELTQETILVAALCKYNPAFVDELQDKHFLVPQRAQLWRAKFEKLLTDKQKKEYEVYKAMVRRDYEKAATEALMAKLKSGETPVVTINDVKFTLNSAEYENIKIEATDLVKHVIAKLDITGQFDIYNVIEVFAKQVQEKLDEPSKTDVKCDTITINGIPVNVTLDSKNDHRLINGVRINKTELARVIARASCERKAENYKLLLEEVSDLSLIRRDILASGLGVKIHNMGLPDYDNPEPSAEAPKLFFQKLKNRVYLKVGKEEKDMVRIDFGKVIKKIQTMNKLTNNKPGTTGGNKDYNWSRAQMIAILQECTTFNEVDPKNKAAGKVKTCLFTEEHLKHFQTFIEKCHEEAIERSKKFLEAAVKATGSVEMTYNTPTDGPQKGYKVKGEMSEYWVGLVHKNNNHDTIAVYNLANNRYICIVNDNHYKGVGFDDVAARIFALKNDKRVTQDITTIRGAQ